MTTGQPLGRPLGRPLGLDELMIVNPGPSGVGAVLLDIRAGAPRVQGLGRFFLGGDGTLYQLQGRFLLGHDGTLYEVVR
jgi:hypothetical protein